MVIEICWCEGILSWKSCLRPFGTFGCASGETVAVRAAEEAIGSACVIGTSGDF